MKYLRWAILAAVVVAGVQFAMVYVNRMQLKSIMDAEGLDARRAKTSVEEVEERIKQRASATNVHIPDEVEISIEGIGERDEDIVIKAWYTDQVNLFVTKIPIDMEIVSVAGAPEI